MLPDWNNAQVAEPINWDGAEHFGAFVLNTNQATIFSMTPAEDFEINTNVIQGWRLVFVDGEEILGDLDYFVALARLKRNTLDEQNGSMLIKALSRQELQQTLNQ